MTTESSPLPEEPALPDEVWEQFLQDSERDIRASAPKEPSARARIVARRLREEQERAEQAARGSRRWWRPRSRAERRATAWRAPVTDAGEARARRRGLLRGLLAVVLVVAVLLVVLSPSHAWSLLTGKG
jgi:hypothetical protein